MSFVKMSSIISHVKSPPPPPPFTCRRGKNTYIVHYGIIDRTMNDDHWICNQQVLHISLATTNGSDVDKTLQEVHSAHVGAQLTLLCKQY